MSTTLSFESTLAASPEEVWAWITSFDGISREMAPILQMSAPKGMRNMASIPFQPGVPMDGPRLALKCQRDQPCESPGNRRCFLPPCLPSLPPSLCFCTDPERAEYRLVSLPVDHVIEP